jgi:prepilin-type N-terminal cleavage/methylation domain-containing protein
MKQYENQKGFTLLELLISIAILAVVITPFLMVYLTTTTMNAKSKASQQAKVAATNIMEEIRSMSVEEVLEKSTPVAGEDGTADGTYQYTKVQTVNGTDYTVVATLDPTYTTDDTAGSETDEATDYNHQGFAELYSMNSAYDAFYEVDVSQDNQAIAEIARGDNNNGEAAKQGVLDNLYRIITLTIRKESGVTKVYAKTHYGVSGDKVYDVSEQCVYSNGSETDNLRNIYLFYQPLYNNDSYHSGYNSNNKETINIINEANIPCTVYVCEQNSNAARENNYLINLRLVETARSDSDLIANGKVQVVTHVWTNVDSDRISAYQGKRSDTVSNRKLNLMYGFDSGTVALERAIGGKTYYASQLMDLNTLAGEHTEDLVYKVTVKAYKGTGENKANESSVTLESTTQ